MEKLLKQILEETKKTNEAIIKINEKLEENEKFQEITIRQFGEIKDKLMRIDIQLDRLKGHATQHHDEIELVAIQVRGLQREPSKNDITEYLTKKRFSIVEVEEE